MYFLYVLKNCNGILYKGITNSISRRVKEHNNNEARGTRGKGPWRLVYLEKHSNLKEARVREKYFKIGCGREELKSIISRIGGA